MLELVCILPQSKDIVESLRPIRRRAAANFHSITSSRPEHFRGVCCLSSRLLGTETVTKAETQRAFTNSASVLFQMLVTILALGLLRFIGYVQFPALDRSIPRKVSYLALIDTLLKAYLPS